MKTTTTTTFSVNNEAMEKLDKLSKKTGIKKSTIISRLIVKARVEDLISDNDDED